MPSHRISRSVFSPFTRLRRASIAGIAVLGEGVETYLAIADSRPSLASPVVRLEAGDVFVSLDGVAFSNMGGITNARCERNGCGEKATAMGARETRTNHAVGCKKSGVRETMQRQV